MFFSFSSLVPRFFTTKNPEEQPMKINKTRKSTPTSPPPSSSTSLKTPIIPSPPATMVNKKERSAEGLANRALLDKVDKLRELGISGMVPLPQMVVVGDQSAGKSSVLESLTGFHFPRSVTLCTRHATEIICRREEQERIVISINAVDADEEKAKGFRREATNLDADEFAKIFSDAAEVMGIKSDNGEGFGTSAFSRDVLRVEISGPNEDHLTVIDVPGMFENETPGLTTKSDIELVKKMVRDYINESRTIILAVVPCNGDIANQKILTYAAEADPEGKRTLGVLTKPDLAIENATRNVIVDLVRGKRRDLQLGYCLVKNRGADDTTSTADERNRKEKAFFSEAPWTSLPADRLGIPALKIRLQQLLMDRTKSEFPKVRAELASKLKEFQGLLKDMGEARSTTEQQRIYIGAIADQFNTIKNYGLDAYYTRHAFFTDRPDLKLITQIREINERFSNMLHSKGHTREFAVTVSKDQGGKKARDDKLDYNADDFVERDALYDYTTTFTIPSHGENELDDILSDPFGCPRPTSGDIMEYIEREYLTSRGYEMGTFSGEMLPVTFQEQAKKWPMLAQAHVSNAVLIVHHFIHSVIEYACPNPAIRAELWAHLLEDLQKKYQAAVNHANFLLNVEFTGKSITYNPAFEEKLAMHKLGFAEKLKAGFDEESEEDNKSTFLDKVLDIIGKTDTVEATVRAIHDVLKCYYEISRSRFVDIFCQQVIDYYLLQAPDGPLNVLSQQAVLHLTADQLEAIAGEDLISREQREKLGSDIADLTKALKILRA